ncbi:MAG: ATPase [Prevotella sp.]|nr:ATPase [Prevotella sp.]
MTLIADSGGTKTHWAIAGSGCVLAVTQGMNPVHRSDEELAHVVADELLPHVADASAVGRVCFYGAGCTGSGVERIARLLQEVFPKAAIEAGSDLIGAARALFADGEGIACILGTGANSGLYDGCGIVANTPPLGYILGDEGSGANLGIRLANALYKGRLPRDVAETFGRETGLTYADVISRVYREPMANRFLASLAPFVCRHLDVPEVALIADEAFDCFLARNVMPYGRRDLPVGFVGGVAWSFREHIAEAVARAGMRMGPVVQNPIEVLMHSSLSNCK